MLQSSIARLGRSLMAPDRTLACEVLHAICLMSRLVEYTHLVEAPCLWKYHVMWKKKYFQEGI